MTQPTDLEYTVQIWKEGEHFIAHAMPLDVMSSGRTEEAAREALDEAVSLFLETFAEVGASGDGVLRREVAWDLKSSMPQSAPPGAGAFASGQSRTAADAEETLEESGFGEDTH